MAKVSRECGYVVDVHGLYAIAKLSSNLKAVMLAKLQSGEVGVLSIVWQEFAELYEAEAADLAKHVARKITLSKKYQIKAAIVAEKLNSGFPSGAYDQYSDLYSGSVATVEGYTVVTSADHTEVYEDMECQVTIAAKLASH